MAKSLRVLRRKIRTTESIWQITRAMSMVSAVQLRRVQSGVERRREYFERLTGMLGRVSASHGAISHPYLRELGEQHLAGLVLAAGDRGLCGGYNGNVLRLADGFVRNFGCEIAVIAVGAKAVAHARRNNYNMIEAYHSLKDIEDVEKASRICRQIRGHYEADHFDSLHVAYTKFESPSRHVPTVTQVLPIARNRIEGTGETEYIFEPSGPELINTLLPMAVEAEVRYYLLQALASEHAARMIAMTASADNAEEMRDTLIRDLNCARQHKITSEVLEVATGAEALGHL